MKQREEGLKERGVGEIERKEELKERERERETERERGGGGQGIVALTYSSSPLVGSLDRGCEPNTYPTKH